MASLCPKGRIYKGKTTMTEQRHDAAEVKTLWKERGGYFFGPNVEQACIEEQAFYRFCKALAQASEARLIAKLQSEEARERVARIIYSSHQNSIETPFEKLHDVAVDDLLDTATAALASMASMLGDR